MRVGTTVNGATSSYLWDRQATYPQLVDDGSVAYLHNNGPLSQIDGSGNRTYLLTDALHSVRGMVDGAGALVGTTDYAAFGALRKAPTLYASVIRADGTVDVVDVIEFVASEWVIHNCQQGSGHGILLPYQGGCWQAACC